MYSNHMSISHRLSLISTHLRPHYKNSPMTPKWPWKLQIQSYSMYLALLPSSFKFHSVLLYDSSIIEVFGFSIGYNGAFQIFEKKIVKNRKLKISKIPNIVFRGPIGGNIRSLKLSAEICRNSVLKFSLPYGPMLMKTNKQKKNHANFTLKILKIPNIVLWGPLGTKFRKSLKAFGCDL